MRVYREPANRFVAGFIGTPSMNFIPVELQAGDSGPEVVGSGFRFALP